MSISIIIALCVVACALIMLSVISKRTSKSRLNTIVSYSIVIVAFVVLSIMADNKILNKAMRGQLVPITVYVVMAIALNLVVGISGELSLGHAAFMSVGAFSGVVSSALFTVSVPNETIRLILAMIIGAAFAAVAGVIIGIPVLRLQGDYLAIVTLAFGEIIRNVMNVLYISMDEAGVHFSFNNPTVPGKLLVNGPQGAQKISQISTFAMGFALILFALFVVLNLVYSRSGRAIMAIRDNRIAAESVGIGTMKYKLMAFVISAALAGMAGALYGLNYSSIVASKFKFDTSILILVFVVLGGIGNIWGGIISASVLTVLPELLRAFSDYRMLVYAIVLVAVMLGTNRRWKAMLNALLVLTLVPVVLCLGLSTVQLITALVIYAVVFFVINFGFDMIRNSISNSSAKKENKGKEGKAA